MATAAEQEHSHACHFGTHPCFLFGMATQLDDKALNSSTKKKTELPRQVLDQTHLSKASVEEKEQENGPVHIAVPHRKRHSANRGTKCLTTQALLCQACEGDREGRDRADATGADKAASG